MTDKFKNFLKAFQENIYVSGFIALSSIWGVVYAVYEHLKKNDYSKQKNAAMGMLTTYSDLFIALTQLVTLWAFFHLLMKFDKYKREAVLKEELEKVKTDNTQSIEAVKSSHQEGIQTLVSEHEKNTQTIISAHKKDVEGLVLAHEKTMKTMALEHQTTQTYLYEIAALVNVLIADKLLSKSNLTIEEVYNSGLIGDEAFKSILIKSSDFNESEGRKKNVYDGVIKYFEVLKDTEIRKNFTKTYKGG